MRRVHVVVIAAAVCLAAAAVWAGDGRLVTADDFIEAMSRSGSADESMPGAVVDGQKPRFRLRGISAQAKPPEVTINILFKTDSIEVAAEFSRKQMAEAGKAIASESLRPYRFEIAGHTDSVGTEAYNQVLSEKRARALKQFLINQYGIDGNRLETIGYGESRPVAPNDTDTGRAMNRRVVFKRLD